MSRRIRTLTLLVLTGFAAAAAVGGCGLEGSDPSADRDRPGYERPRDGHDDGRPRYDDRGRFEPRDRADGIPSSARLMEQGKGVVSFTAGRDGRVFVEDTHDLKLLLETQLFEGETLTIDPQADTIAIDGKPLPGPKRTRKLANDHRHRVYFFGDRTVRPHSGGSDGNREIGKPRERDVKY